MGFCLVYDSEQCFLIHAIPTFSTFFPNFFSWRNRISITLKKKIKSTQPTTDRGGSFIIAFADLTLVGYFNNELASVLYVIPQGHTFKKLNLQNP